MEREAKKHVLLVEDLEEDVFFFRRALSKSGVDVELAVAGDGKAATSLLSDPALRRRLSLVFLDLKLPLLDGFDVLRWIRSQNFDPPLRVVVLSGSPHKSDKALSQELGAPDYLVKPISPESIRERLLVS